MNQETRGVSIVITLEGPIDPRQSVDLIYDQASKATRTLLDGCHLLRVDRASHDVMVGRYEAPDPTVTHVGVGVGVDGETAGETDGETIEHQDPA